MLKIVVEGGEVWDEKKREFGIIPKTTLRLEHSLLSISKWEEKWKKPYLDNHTEKTPEEQLDYIRCMSIDSGVDPSVYLMLTPAHLQQIHDYIEDPHTATTFHEEEHGPKNRSIMTAELIYWQMFELKIPLEFEKRHFNKLMTLIRVCAIKNSPPKKRNKSKAAAWRHELNRKRRAELGTSG